MALVNAAAGPASAGQAPLVPVVIGAPPPQTAAVTAGGFGGGGGGGGKDSRWLTLEVCREFARSKCSRSDEECKYAHPPPHVEIQNGRVMCCFDSIKGKCQRKDPPCKYLHPPQHLKEILLQNGRQNLIYKNLQMQAATLQQIVPVNPAVIPVVSFMYDSGAGVKQPTFIQATGFSSAAAGAYANGGMMLSAGPSAAAGGQYITMVPHAAATPPGQQYLLPAAATGYPCYSPSLQTALASGFYQAGAAAALDVSGSSGVSGQVLSPAAPGANGTWSIAGLPAGCYGLPSAAVHAISYDGNSISGHYPAVQNLNAGSSALPSSATSAGALVTDQSPSGGTTPPLSSSSSTDGLNTVTSSAYCQPVYYKRQVVEVMAGPGMGRKRTLEPSGDDLILGVGAVPGSIVPMLKRPALIDAKTGLPVYRQFATAASYQQMAALNTVQQLQSQQQFVSIPIAGTAPVLPRF